jgi:hypothetical protein
MGSEMEEIGTLRITILVKFLILNHRDFY